MEIVIVVVIGLIVAYGVYKYVGTEDTPSGRNTSGGRGSNDRDQNIR